MPCWWASSRPTNTCNARRSPALSSRTISAGAPRTFRSGGSAARRNLRTSPASWSPTQRLTSPARRSTWTAAIRRWCKRLFPGAPDQRLGAREAVGRRLRHLGGELLQRVAAERLDVHAGLRGLGEEFRIFHGLVEGTA